jgi:potassium efflux system protein
MFLMLIVVLPWPVLLLGLGLSLEAGEGITGFSGGVARAAITAAVLWAVAAWCSLALSAEGLVGAHFPAEAVAVRRSRRVWRNFGRVFVPAYSLAVNFEFLGFTAAQDSMARALFLLSMLALLALGTWLVRRDNPFAHASFGLSREPQAFLWRVALLVPPIVLSALSASGYHYTATELSRYYLMSAGLVAAAILAYQLALRWISIAEYRTRCERSLEMPETSETTPDEAEYERLNAQARLVMRNVIGWSLALGLFGVWQTVLPALTVLEHVTLWEITVTDPEGGVRSQAVTIANLLLAVVTGLVAMIASWNLPGVIEIGLLQRLRMKQGSRYALTSLLQYGIVALGLSMALSTLGLRWSQVQWLVAALGVGLGFGLQEIFANFISGLILLFERPIRVGDFVTIGELSGRVIRIRIRATTLRDVDNKELIVPNKNFITERFSNWTLSDQVTRVVINVGVAYGSNVEQAMTILQEVAASHPKVMPDPAPAVTLTGFGDSALNLELTAFAEELSARVDVRNTLNLEILRRFAEAGIEIPFPQREVHLRSGASAAGAA